MSAASNNESARTRWLRPTAPSGAAAADRSAWVAASAGSGKTKVLTDRVLSLLLAGGDPGRILCLTFTKAAAAEMAVRVTGRLAKWAVTDEAVLHHALAQLLGRQARQDELLRARRLFARLDVPGGMKIQTVHGFCQSVLRRFPWRPAFRRNSRC